MINGEYLSKRLQQVMEIVYQLGQVTASDIEERLAGQPTNATVRTHLRILEERGHLRHEDREGKFVYFPVHERPEAAKTAVQKVLETFFSGSTEAAFAALLDARDRRLSDEEVERLHQLIDNARRRAR